MVGAARDGGGGDLGWLAIFSLPDRYEAQAQVLKQIPGQILIVTRAGRTPRQALLDAIALIDKSKLHGLVLNDAHASSGDGYHTHYGYSGYDAIGR